MSPNKRLDICNKRYTCPCCGYFSFNHPPGSYDICPICLWEDDEVQLRQEWWDQGGANPPLRLCQANYVKFGVCKPQLASCVRPPTAEDERDTAWFPLPPLDEGVARETKTGRDYFNQYCLPASKGEDLYYWLWVRNEV